MDAILAFDEQGKPYEPEWPAADVVIGNPPFVGGSKLRRELGDKYAETLWALYTNRVPGGADLVTYWFERARALVADGKVQRVGLLATQAIRAGANHRVLERIKESGSIFMAWSDRAWVLDGAAVRVSIVGFDNGTETNRLLNGEPVVEINDNLTSEINVTRALRLAENANIAFQGPSKKGPFEIDAHIAHRMLAADVNANGRPNSDVVKQWANGSDITGRSREMWIIDFGVGLTEQQASYYDLPFQHIKNHVYPVRALNRRAAYAEKWWQHAEARPGMRKALQGRSKYIVTPRVAKHRLFIWLNATTLADDRTFVFARDDDYFFGILHSRIHEVWSLATASRHGDGDEGGRPTYNNGVCFETFPFPWAPGTEDQADPRVQAIAAAAQRLVELRDAWLNPPDLSDAELKKRTLTNLYNTRPEWLAAAHAQLDAAVCDAYGWTYDLTDEQILERLLALNLGRVAKGEATSKVAEVEETDHA